MTGWRRQGKEGRLHQSQRADHGGERERVSVRDDRHGADLLDGGRAARRELRIYSGAGKIQADMLASARRRFIPVLDSSNYGQVRSLDPLVFF